MKQTTTPGADALKQDTQATSKTAEQQAQPEEDRPTMLHNTVTSWRTECHSTYIDARAVGTASVALSGLQTILAILMQNEADKGCDGPGRLVLKSYTVEGLICAAESCAEMVGAVIDGHHVDAHSFNFDTLAQRYMSQEAWRATRGAEFTDTSAAGGSK